MMKKSNGQTDTYGHTDRQKHKGKSVYPWLKAIKLACNTITLTNTRVNTNINMCYEYLVW